MYHYIKALLKRHEGAVKKDGRHVVYDDATGKPLKPGDKLEGWPTIGYGLNLVTRGLTEEEADALLQHAIAETAQALAAKFPVFRELTEPRQAALTDMAYNLGVGGIAGFKKMWTALGEGWHAEKDGRTADANKAYRRAAEEMRTSKWAAQVGQRAETLARMIETGVFSQEH